MIITAVLITIGISALIGLKETSKVNRTATDFISQSKTDISKARHNVYTPTELNLLTTGSSTSCSEIPTHDFVPDAVGYYFENNRFQTIKCLSTRISTVSNFCCVKYNSGTTLINLSDPKINYGADCKAVLFEYSTGDVLTSASESLSSIAAGNDTDCNVTIYHTSIGYRKNIIFNVDSNAVNLQEKN